MSIRSTLVATPDRNGLDAQRTATHELRRIKSAVIQSAEGQATEAKQDLILTALNSLSELFLASNWSSVIGNTITYSYYTGIEIGNPSGNTNNVETAEYSDGTGLIYTQTFTYDSSDNVLTIVTI
jgi:hypothetical protein